MLRIRYTTMKRYLQFVGGFLFIMMFFEMYHLEVLSKERHRMDFDIRYVKPLPINFQRPGNWKRNDNYGMMNITIHPEAKHIGSKIHTRSSVNKFQSVSKPNQLNLKHPVSNDTKMFDTNALRRETSKKVIHSYHFSNETYKRFRLTKTFHNMDAVSAKDSLFHKDIANLSNKVKIFNSRSVTKLKNGEVKNSSYVKLIFDLSGDDVEAMIDEAIQWFILDNNSSKDELLNKHNFVYLINSKLCSRPNISVLIIVHSAFTNTEKRDRIRNSWGSIKRYRNATVVTIFMLGKYKTVNSHLQRKLTKESEQFGDIVQGNFIDSYKNLTYKNIMDLHWITSQCRDVRTIVKIDDDVFVDVYKLVEFSINSGHIHNKLYCTLFENQQPKRAGKWRISTQEYPIVLYPIYCEGMAYIMSMDEARKLRKASEDMRFCWIDDLFVTGIIARRAGLGHVQLRAGHTAVKKQWFKNESTAGMDHSMFFTDFKDWNALFKKAQNYHHVTVINSTSISSNRTIIHS